MKKTFLGLCLFLSFIGKAQTTDEPEWMKQMGSRTAKQTWWFFDKRLKEPLDYTFQHVYIDFMNVYIKDIKQLPSGKYQGLVDLDLPHDPSFDENNQEIKFDSAEIDDWFMVSDRYLVGGFYIRTLSFQETQQLKRHGNFNISRFSINDDFIESSKLPPSDDHSFIDGDYDFFIGGKKGLLDSLKSTLVYTPYARMMNIEGSVTLRFTIETTGNISNIKVLRGVGGGLSDVARSVLFQLKNCWKPYIVNGEATEVSFTLPIVFKLN